MSDNVIAKDSRKACKRCEGTGNFIEPKYRDTPAYQTDYLCSDCSGKGWIWNLTIQQMAERVSAAESALAHANLHWQSCAKDSEMVRGLLDKERDNSAALKAENERLKAPVSDEECHKYGWMIGDRFRFDPENVDDLISARIAKAFEEPGDNNGKEDRN